MGERFWWGVSTVLRKAPSRPKSAISTDILELSAAQPGENTNAVVSSFQLCHRNPACIVSAKALGHESSKSLTKFPQTLEKKEKNTISGLFSQGIRLQIRAYLSCHIRALALQCSVLPLHVHLIPLTNAYETYSNAAA